MAATYYFLNDHTEVLVQLLAGQPNGKPYRIGAMYIEFENNAGAAVDIPTVDNTDPAEGRDYYDALSSPRDYQRVPINTSVLSSTDEDLYTKNKVTYYGQTQGSTGEGALVFSAENQSRVYGGALVATPDYGDPTQDLIVARFYFPAGEQSIKVAGGQVFVPASLTFLNS